MSKVMISTDALRTHAKKVKIFETTIDDMNSKLTAMTNQLNSAWVDTNCTAFCNTVQDLQKIKLNPFVKILFHYKRIWNHGQLHMRLHLPKLNKALKNNNLTILNSY